MTDLIDRECLKAYISNKEGVNKNFSKGWNSAIEAIYVTAKSVNPQKVGRWIPLMFFNKDTQKEEQSIFRGMKQFKCSECKMDGFGTPYCAICGAKMEGE